MDIKVESKSNVLVSLIKTLNKYEVLRSDYSLVDNSIEITSYKILNKKVFLEVGFGIFLGWFYDHKRERFDTGQYNFINLDKDYTLFLYKSPNMLTINNYKPDIYVEKMFDGTPSGSRRHRLCPLCHLLKYNLGCLDEELKDIDVPISSGESCLKHKEEIKAWVIKKIKENEKCGKMLGGDSCLLHVNPEIFEILFTEKTVRELNEKEKAGYNSLEELLNSFLVLYVASLHEFKSIASNARITSPILSHEIDAFLWNKRDSFLIVLETTGESAIDRNHLKRKIYTATVLHTLDISNYVYKYITLGCEDDLRGNSGHVWLYEKLGEKYGVPFDLIPLPNRFKDVKDKNNRFKSKTFREIYQHYLDGLNNIFR